MVPGYGARVRYSLGANVHTPFLSTHARIRARCRCPSTRSRPCTRAQQWAPAPCVHTTFVRSWQSTALFSVLSSYFKMASDGAKWSKYMDSHISGTQHHFVPVSRHWFPSTKCGQPLRHRSHLVPLDGALVRYSLVTNREIKIHVYAKRQT